MYSKRAVMKLVMLMQLHLSWAIFRRDLSRGGLHCLLPMFVSRLTVALGDFKNVWRRKRNATEAGGC